MSGALYYIHKEIKAMKCCFCGKDVGTYGFNPWPIYKASDKTCCDRCNCAFVIPARLGLKVYPPKESNT